MGHVLSIYLEGYLGGFQVLAIRNTVAVNILIEFHVDMFVTPLGKY